MNDCVYDAGYKATEPRDWHGRWSEMAEAARKRVLEAHHYHDPSISELVDNFDEAVAKAEFFQTAADWYDRHRPLAKKLFGPLEPLFEKFLAATSPNTKVRDNVRRAVKALEHYITHGNFEHYSDLPVIVIKLKEAIKGEITGEKVNPFSHNLQGEWDVVTIDRWMKRFFFKHPQEKSPSPQQVAVGTQIVIDIAKKLKFKPAELQAIFWATSQFLHPSKTGYRPEDYSTELKAESIKIKQFLDKRHIAHDAAESENPAVILAKMFLSLFEKAITLINALARGTHDAGFDPTEPRDWHGKWTKGKSGLHEYEHYVSSFAPPSIEVDALNKEVKLAKVDDLPDELWRHIKKEMHATDVSIKEHNQYIAAGITDAFADIHELAERSDIQTANWKNTKFIFAEFEPSFVCMATLKDIWHTGEDAFMVNASDAAVAESLRVIKNHKCINYSGQRLFKHTEKWTDQELMREYYKVVFEHEFGHWLDNQTGGALSQHLQAKIMTSLYKGPQEFMAYPDKLERYLIDNISDYAVDKPQEAWAEGFARWMNDPNFKLKSIYDNVFSVEERRQLEMKFVKDMAREPIELFPDPKRLDKKGKPIFHKEEWDWPEHATDTTLGVQMIPRPNEPPDFYERAFGMAQAGAGENEFKRQEQYANDARGAGLAIMDPKGYMLFIRRNDHSDHAGTWALPGGKVEHGELPEKAAEREAIEEIGYVSHGEYPVSFTTHEPVSFKTFVTPVEHQFEPSWLIEHSDYTWRKPDNPPEPLHPGVRNLLYQMKGYAESHDEKPDRPCVCGNNEYCRCGV